MLVIQVIIHYRQLYHVRQLPVVSQLYVFLHVQGPTKYLKKVSQFSLTFVLTWTQISQTFVGILR